MRYVEFRLIASENIPDPNTKDAFLPKRGEWQPHAEVNKPSRRQAMKHFASLDDKDLPSVQRKVRQDENTLVG